MRVRPKKENALTINPVSPNSKNVVHNVFIIDASGSMSGYRYENAINGVNVLLKDISEDTFTDNTVSVIEFEGNNIARKVFMSTDSLKSYSPMGTGGMTPLNQAIGETCEAVLEMRYKNFSSDDKVLVNVFTDGMENHSSGKYRNPEVLSKFIKELEAVGFTVTFQGNQAEVNYAINTLNLSFTNTSVHDNSAKGIADTFKRTAKARVMYSKSVSLGEDVVQNFYSKSVEPTDDNK